MLYVWFGISATVFTIFFFNFCFPDYCSIQVLTTLGELSSVVVGIKCNLNLGLAKTKHCFFFCLNLSVVFGSLSKHHGLVHMRCQVVDPWAEDYGQTTKFLPVFQLWLSYRGEPYCWCGSKKWLWLPCLREIPSIPVHHCANMQITNI